MQCALSPRVKPCGGEMEVSREGRERGDRCFPRPTFKCLMRLTDQHCKSTNINLKMREEICHKIITTDSKL